MCKLAYRNYCRDIIWIGKRDSCCRSEDITRSFHTTNCKFMFLGRSGLKDFVTDNWMWRQAEFALILKIDIRVFKMCRYVWNFPLDLLHAGLGVLRPTEINETSSCIKTISVYVNVFLIVLRFCLSICYGSSIVVCEAIATLVFVCMAVLGCVYRLL